MTSGPSPSPASHPGFGNNNGGGGGGVGGGKLNVKTKQELNTNEANLANLLIGMMDRIRLGTLVLCGACSKFSIACSFFRNGDG